MLFDRVFSDYSHLRKVKMLALIEQGMSTALPHRPARIIITCLDALFAEFLNDRKDNGSLPVTNMPVTQYYPEQRSSHGYVSAW